MTNSLAALVISFDALRGTWGCAGCRPERFRTGGKCPMTRPPESKSDLVNRSRKNSCQLTVRVLFGELSDGYANQNPRSHVFVGRGLGDLPHGFEATPKAHRASPTTPSPARPRSAFRTATSPARFHSLPARPDSAAVDNRNCRLPIRSETCGEPGSSL